MNHDRAHIIIRDGIDVMSKILKSTPNNCTSFKAIISDKHRDFIPCITSRANICWCSAYNEKNIGRDRGKSSLYEFYVIHCAQHRWWMRQLDVYIGRCVTAKHMAHVRPRALISSRVQIGTDDDASSNIAPFSHAAILLIASRNFSRDVVFQGLQLRFSKQPTRVIAINTDIS